jgi:hypothetical protein
MASLVDVVNQALIRLGHSRINALSDNIRAASIANAEATYLLDDELRRGVWKFARGRTKLVVDTETPAWGYAYRYHLPDGLGADPWCIRVMAVEGEDEGSGRWTVEGRYLLTDVWNPEPVTGTTAMETKTFTSSDVATGTERITITSHGYTTGDGPCWLEAGTGGLPTGLSGATDYYVGVVDANTIRLFPTRDDAVADTNVVNLTAAGGAGPHRIGAPGLSILYVGRVTDPEVMDAAFRSLLVARYAAAWAEAITGSPQKIQECEARLLSERRQAGTSDAQQGIPDENESSDWIAARWGGSAGSL